MKISILITVVWLLSISPVLACSIAIVPHELDPHEQRIDTTAPERISAQVEKITRGRGPVNHPDGTVSMSSCDDLGSVVLKFEPEPKDDRTPPDKLGYILIHTDGELPRNFALSDSTVRAGEKFHFYWIDGATDDQEPLEFAVSLIAVDLAGNKSEPSEPIWVRHPGSE